MNSEAAALRRKLDASIHDAGGLEAFRCTALTRLRPKVVVKESHCCQIQGLAANTADAACRNLFATAAHGQVTIYDDAHLGDHLAVVAQYAPPHAGGRVPEFHCCAWLPPQPAASGAAPGDAWLAAGCSDRAIHIISVAEAAVVRRLEGHESDPVELSASPAAPRLLLALCRDGSAALWDVSSGARLAVTPRGDAFSAALAPCGSFFLVGTRGGRLHRWRPAAGADQQQQQEQQQEQQQQQQQQQQAAAGGQRQHALAEAGEEALLAAWRGSGGGGSLVKEPVELPGLGSVAIDALRFLQGDRLLARCLDGRVLVFHWPSLSLQAQWRVPGCSAAAGASHPSKPGLGATGDGRVVACGNARGQVLLFDAGSGGRISCCEPYRVEAGVVRGCAVSDDGRHVLSTAGPGFLFRYECRWPAESGAKAAGGDSDAGAGGGDQQQWQGSLAPAAGGGGGGGGEASAGGRVAGMLLDEGAAMDSLGQQPLGKRRRAPDE